MWPVAVGQAKNRPDWTTSHLSLEIQPRTPYMDEEGLQHSRRDPGVWILTLLQPEMCIMIPSEVQNPMHLCLIYVEDVE